MHLSFKIDGHLMGESFKTNETLTVKAWALGTAFMEKLILMRGREIVHTVFPDSFEENGSSSRIRISWESARIWGRARRANWDGRIKLSGPLLLKAEPFAFDSPADGIVSTNNTEVVFKSSTVGDVDGIDLFLDRADCGSVTFESNIGEER